MSTKGLLRVWKTAVGSLMAGILLIMAAPASAVPTYNFAEALGGPEGLLPGSSASYTDGPVTATGQYWDGAAWVDAPLWVRNVSNDHGFGVCSPGEDCSSGGGDVNELSQLTNAERIVLSLADGWFWSGLWLSSLDSNASGPDPEQGFVTGFGGSQSFGYPEFGGSAVEGDLSNGGWAGGNSDLFFYSGTGLTTDTGANEDYLVWGVDARTPSVPEPGALSLLGLGLLGLAFRSRRRARA